MPPRSRVALQNLSSLELPILPFLAPRVFNPWPPLGRQSHFTTRELSKITSRTESHELRPTLSSGDDHHVSRPVSLDEQLHRLERGTVNTKCHEGESSPGPSDSQHTGRTGRAWSSSLSSTDEVFRRRYEDIWGNNHGSRQLHPSKSSGASKTEAETTEDSTRFTALGHVVGIGRVKSSGLKVMRQKASRFRRVRVQPGSLKRRGYKRPLQLTRPKFVRLSPNTGSVESGYSSFWNRMFAVINFKHSKFRGYQRSQKVNLTLRYAESHRLKRALLEDSPISTLSDIWLTIPELNRSQIWLELMLMTLARYPDSALKLLMATYTSPYPPSYAVTDALDFVSCYYLQDRENVDLDRSYSVLETILNLLRQGPPGYLELTQNTIYLLLSNLDGAHLKTFYLALLNSNHVLHQNTLMQFISRLARFGEIDLAFGGLQRLRSLGVDFNSPQISSICTTILHRKPKNSSSNSADARVSDSELFEFMLQCGFKPNKITFNVLIQNAVHSGDHETAWRIHDMMSENGVDADGFTYSILLHDAKLYRDEQAIQNIIEMVREKELQNAHIITDFLHAIFLLHPGRFRRPSATQVSSVPEEGPHVWDRMSAVYINYFKSAPLARLIPDGLPHREALISAASREAQNMRVATTELDYNGQAPVSESQPEEALSEPPVPTLFVMLVGLLNSFTRPQHAKLFYEHFHSLVLAGDPAVSSLVQTPRLYNIILLALGQFAENTSACSRLIGDMLPPKISTSNNDGDISDSSSEMNDAGVKIPKPDIYTWSILLKVFIDNQQARAAEKVLSIMQSHNITPNHVTWKSLVSGYARMNDPIMVARTLGRLQEEMGVEAEDITRKALEQTRDYTALIAAMRAQKPKLRSARKAKILKQTFEVLDRAAEVMKEDRKQAPFPAQEVE